MSGNFTGSRQEELSRRQRGEVFTPVDLVREMLDTVPEAVWRDGSLRWLDPCAGHGVFAFEIFRRLTTRYGHDPEHVLARMLWLCDMDMGNCERCDARFGGRANVICGDILGLSAERHGGRFDVIVGNPPFHCPRRDKVARSDGTSDKVARRDMGRKNSASERIIVHCGENLLRP